MKRALAVLLLLLPGLCLAKSGPYPKCDGYPTYWAHHELRKAGLLVQDLDYANPQAVLLAVERVRDESDGERIWLQIYHITFREKNGKEVKVITANRSGDLECSISDIEMFIVSGHIPPAGTGRLFKDIE